MTRLIFVSIFCLALAIGSALHAVGSVTAVKNPGLAISVYPINGFGYAYAGQQLLAANQKPLKDLRTIEVPGKAKEFALRAFALEPTTINAIQILGYDASSEGKDSSASKIFLKASALSKRDVNTNIWLIDHFGRQNNIPAILEKYDQTLRASRDGRALLMPVLQQGLINDEMVDPMVNLLQNDPPWASEFWSNIHLFESSLINVARLRGKLAKKSYAIAPIVDQRIIAELITQGEFESAEELFSRLDPGQNPNENGGVLRASGFDELSLYTPFQWQTFYGNQVNASIDPDQGVLTVNIFADGNGRVVRQLFKMKPGRFRLSARFSQWDVEAKNSLYAEIMCAEEPASEGESIQINLRTASERQDFVNELSSCSYFWIDVFAREHPSQKDIYLQLTELAITPVS